MARNKYPVLFNEEQLELRASQVGDIYHQMARDLFDEVIDRLLERGTESLADNPYIWQLERMSQMHMLNEQNLDTIARYSKIGREQLRKVIEDEGFEIYQTTKEQLIDDLGGGDFGNSKHAQELLSGYFEQSHGDISNLINTTLPGIVTDVYRQMVQEVVARQVVGLVTHDKAVSQTVMKWQEIGFKGFIDRGGHYWKVDNYARTVIKTTVMRSYREMRTMPADELGIDTFYYSKKATAREACAPLQHHIVTYGPAREEHGISILSLADHGYGTAGGCLGINCGHMLTPFVPGINELPELGPDVKNVTQEEAIRNANAQSKQRAYERAIRKSKEKLHVAEKLGDQELISKFKTKIRDQQATLRDYIADKPFLHRDYAREKYHVNPYTKASKQLEKAIESGKIVSVNSSTVGHTPPGRIGTPNTIVQHDSVNGEVLARAYYDDRGLKSKEVHFTNHGRPDKHPYGLKGEHVHDYTFDDKGKFVNRNTRELSKDEREENLDILWRY